MDKLTMEKRATLIVACSDRRNEIPITHIDVRRMYALLGGMAGKADSSDEVKYLTIAKTTLDLLSKAVID